jgi:uncharacterized protein
MGKGTESFDIEKARAFLLQKEHIRRQKREDEINVTSQKLKNLEPLWKQFHINKVYLYGSFADGRLHSESDIDIAVEGNIDYEQLLRLFCEVDKHFARQIDLRTLEDLPFRDTIRQKGVVVYEE